LAIVGVLVLLAFPAIKGIRERMTVATCTSHMKRIHSALDTYIKDNQHWPQMPEEFFGAEDEEPEWEWWYNELQSYGITKDHWLCPIEKRALDENPERPEFHGSYIPTNFDRRLMTPFRWNQPWLLERGDFHGDGNRMVMPNGAIQLAPIGLGIQ